MKATYNWIKEYVPDFSGDIQEMCDAFTMSGTEVEFYAPLGDDFLIEFSVTSNRVDCLGIVGLARELAAVKGLPLAYPDCEVEESDALLDEVAAVELEDAEGCPRYTAQVIEDVTVGPSPDWLKNRLEAMGLRPVNNVVDVTNFVLFEMNQPFHAFDLDRVAEGKIIVRRGKPGEKVTAINGKSYELDPEMTAICDPTGCVAIAGVMGGESTEVGEKTTRVLLETAAFDMVRIRRASKKLGLSSDASFRFERGTDAQNVMRAARRCAKLIAEVSGGRVRSGIIDQNMIQPRATVIPFRHEQVARITGIEVPWQRCREIFEALELWPEGDPRSGIRVTVPSYRGDLGREIDLVEEVIRIHGLHHLPIETRMPVITVKETKVRRVRDRLRSVFVASGYSEVLTTSFLPEKDARICFFGATEPVTIANAMRQDENALRQSLMSSLLSIRKLNQDRGNSDIRIFESTVIYRRRDDGGIPDHLPIVGGLLDGSYRDARGVIERLASTFGLTRLSFDPLDELGQKPLDTDGGATVKAADGVVLGYVGRPKDDLVSAHDLRVSPFYFELRLDRLEELAVLTRTFTPLSRFPAVKRDLAVILDQRTSWGEIEAALSALGLENLETVDFFDEYRGKQVPAGKKSLAFSLTYRSHERTLTGEEVDATQARAIDTLAQKFSAQLRS